MKKYVNPFLWNGLLLWLLSVGYLYPQYEWYVKAVFYILIPLIIIGLIISLYESETTLEKIKENYLSMFYICMTLGIDIIFLIVFAYLDYKVLFVLYFIHTILSICFKMNIRKKDRENK